MRADADAEYVSALPNRSTRGTRMRALLEDEDDADEAFWTQDAFADESGDDAYESESEEEDVVDADFHDDESSESEGEVGVERERRAKTLKAPERRDGGRTGGVARVGAVREVNEVGGSRRDATAERARAAVAAADVESRKSKRSTAQAILERSEKMRKEREAKPTTERERIVYVMPSQEQLMEETKVTEYYNLLDLERLLTLEAEMKKKAPTTGKKYEGPSLIYRSSSKVDGGAPTIELARGAEPPAPLRRDEAKPAPVKPSVCVITGLPAKYKDPVTGMPYATLDAFKKVRAKYPPLPPKAKLAPIEPEPIEVEEKPTVVFEEPTDAFAVPGMKPAKTAEAKKRKGKPSASKLSTAPAKTLKEEPEDEVFTTREDDDIMAEEDFMGADSMADDMMAEEDVDDGF